MDDTKINKPSFLRRSVRDRLSLIKGYFSKDEVFIFKTFIFSRIMLAFLSVLFLSMAGKAQNTSTFNSNSPMLTKSFSNNYSKSAVLDIWGNWDSAWYMDIANNGYSNSINQEGQSNIVFMPMYPALVNIFSKITFIDKFVVGLLISNLAFLAFITIFYRYCKNNFSEKVAKYACLAIVASPFGYYFSAFYGESLFLLLIFLTITNALKNEWGMASLTLFASILTKLNGWLLMLPLAWVAIQQLIPVIKDVYSGKKNKAQLFRRVAIYFLPVLAAVTSISIYLLINKSVFNNYLAFMDVEKLGWHKQLTNPFSVIYNYARGSQLNLILSLLGVFSFGASVWGIFKLKPVKEISLFFTFVMLTYLSTGMEGITRYSIPILPSYLAIALFIAKKDGREYAIYLMFMLQAVFMCLWVAGHPILM